VCRPRPRGARRGDRAGAGARLSARPGHRRPGRRGVGRARRRRGPLIHFIHSLLSMLLALASDGLAMTVVTYKAITIYICARQRGKMWLCASARPCYVLVFDLWKKEKCTRVDLFDCYIKHYNILLHLLLQLCMHLFLYFGG